MLRILMLASSIDEYVAGFDGIHRERLERIREVIFEVMPEAEQKISWGMPTFKLGKNNAFNFAAFKHHVSLFPSSYAIEYFSEELKPYKTSKGTIQFQNSEPLPIELIRKMALWRKKYMSENPNKG